MLNIRIGRSQKILERPEEQCAALMQEQHQVREALGRLAKSDMSIARSYAGLVEDRSLAERLFDQIVSDWNETHDRLLRITRQARLLEKSPALEASIRLRIPYIEPLNLLQVQLLRRYRAGDDDARVREGIHLSINAVATGLRNSG